MKPLKTGLRADQNPTVPTEKEKRYLREQCRKSAEMLDDVPGLSGTESNILDQVVDGYSYESGFQRPLNQDEYLDVLQQDMDVYFKMLKGSVPGNRAPRPQIRRWLRLNGVADSGHRLVLQNWSVARDQILLGVVRMDMADLKALTGVYASPPVNETQAAVKDMAEIISTISLPDQNGQVRALSSYFKQPGKDLVLVSVWATWCGPCKQEIPCLNDVAQKYPNVTVLGLAQEYSQEDLAAGVKGLPSEPDYPVLLDARAEAKAKLAPKAQGIPHLMYFSNDGKLLKEETGFSLPGDGSNPIAAEVEGLLKESKEAPLDEQSVETVTP